MHLDVGEEEEKIRTASALLVSEAVRCLTS